MREGMERIKILASDVKDNAVLEIVNYLLSREDMNEKYLNEEKSFNQTGIILLPDCGIERIFSYTGTGT